MKKYVSIDVGGTAIKYALMNESGQILEKGETPTSVTGADEYVTKLLEIYDRFGNEAEGMALSAPGKVNSESGYFETGGALKFMDGVNLREKIREVKNIPFTAANDARCAALAELWKGSMRGVRNGAVMTLGTGIGGALILNGELYEGSTFSAGEFSTIPVHWDREFDRHACWYRQQGVGYFSKRYAEKIGSDPDQMNGRILFNEAAEGKPEALEALKEYCDSLASGIYGLQVILDLEKIAIGGGISRQPLLFEILNRSMDELYEEAHGFPASRPSIVSCEFTSDANLIGALYHHLRTA